MKKSLCLILAVVLICICGCSKQETADMAAAAFQKLVTESVKKFV